MIGRAMNGRYELVEILGVGGMATVYRGQDRVLGRAVAVKVLPGGLADDPRFAERFSREAQHAAMLVHPGIVTVFDSGVDQGSPYIVMELVHGCSLSRLVAESVGTARRGAGDERGIERGHGRGLAVERAVGIAAAVCEALQVAHGAGLVHRDIKPGNIMITEDGGVKVVDFGIARASASSVRLTQPATVLGTAAYLSPEQATAAEVDGRSDLYALGCVLVEMLTGEPPFTADTPVAIAYLHVTGQPEPLSPRRPDVPAALDAAVLRLLAKDPADRPADAAAARAELLAAVPSVPGADRTAELLAMGGAAAPTRTLGPVAAATSALPPLTGPGQDGPGQYGPGQYGPGQYGPGPRDPGQHTTVLPPTGAPEPPPRRRSPLLVPGAVLVAVLATGGIGAFALQGSPTSSKAQHAAIRSPAALPPSPAAVTSAPARPPGKPTAATILQNLRASVAQTQFTKPPDRQAALLTLLDQADQAVATGQPAGAAQPLRDAQRLIAEVGKRHSVDNATLDAWRNRINTVLGLLHTQGPPQQDGGDDN